MKESSKEVAKCMSVFAPLLPAHTVQWATIDSKQLQIFFDIPIDCKIKLSLRGSDSLRMLEGMCLMCGSHTMR